MKKVFKYIPIAVVIAGILLLTTQNIHDNAILSEGFRRMLVKIYDWLGFDSSSAWWNDQLAVRRLGHVIEYGLLGVSCAIAFWNRDHKIKSMVKAQLICLAVSVIDQCVKMFVPVRHFDVIDIGFDAVGAIIGVLIVTVIGNIKNRLKEEG